MTLARRLGVAVVGLALIAPASAAAQAQARPVGSAPEREPGPREAGAGPPGRAARDDAARGPSSEVRADAATATVAAAGGAWRVDEALWDRPRSAAALREDAGVRAAVRAWIATPGARLAVRHGSGQNGETRAVELRQWLVALGVDPARIVVEPTRQSGSGLEVAVSGPPR